jgi:hypothetical protein
MIAVVGPFAGMVIVKFTCDLSDPKSKTKIDLLPLLAL